MEDTCEQFESLGGIRSSWNMAVVAREDARKTEAVHHWRSSSVPASYQVAEWIVARDAIRQTFLATPLEPTKRAPRKRIRVSGDVVRLEDLRVSGQSSERSKLKAAKKQKSSARPIVEAEAGDAASHLESREMDHPVTATFII
ncbi:hypothetical protein AC1031_010251 [Aphanomyces cochlioides]|nr:hypothetical protein AC1031_010251 [Aphanomyces cochlioides]